MSYIGTTPAPQMAEIGTGSVETQDIQDSAITTAKLSDNSVTATKLAAGAAVPAQTGQSGKFLTTNGTAASWAVVQTGATITGVTYSGDDLAVDPTTPLQCTLTGTGFVAGTVIYVDTVTAINSATAITVVSSTSITFTPPAGKAANNYNVWAVLPTGVMAVLVNGILYSGIPNWSSQTTSITPANETLNIQLTATGDTPFVYSLVSGTLPTGASLSSTGLISGTATVEAVFPNIVIRATDPQNQDASVTIQITISLKDAFFKNTTLLLSGNPLKTPFDSDASTNNFEITANGDARSDNFTPYRGDGYYGNYFNGSSGVRFPDNAAFTLGTNAFTVEGWFNIGSIPGNDSSIISKWINGNDANSAWMIDFQSSNLSAAISIGGTVTRITGSSGVPLNTWNHFALVRSGSPGTLSLFLNGTRIATGAPTGSIVDDTSPLGIGIRGGTDGFYVTGYISNIRVVNGTDLYGASNTSMTVPTGPLTVVTNTQLLTCRSNRFIDFSSNNFTATAFSSPQVSAAQPFTLPGSVTTYGSGYFDGTGDYLTSPNNAFGTNNFTIEGWFYPTTIANNTNFWGMNNGSGSTPKMVTYISSTGNLTVDMGTAGTTQFPLSASASTNLRTNAWQHIAVVRSGTGASQFVLYINGTSVATGQLGTNISNITAVFNIGYVGEAYGQTFSGYVTDFRINNGTAVYTANFTPSTAPLTAITNTQLLTLQYNGANNNSGFNDSSQFNFPITRNGNATQGTFSPYGNRWSNYFDGDGDGITTAVSAGFAFGTGDFTYEGWYYSLETGSNPRGMFDTRINQSSTAGVLMREDSSGFLVYINGATLFTATGRVANTWQHIALVRNSGIIRLYVNGVQTNSAANTTNFTDTNCRISGFIDTQATPYGYFGYISNARVVKGTCLYPSGTTFTPSITPLTAISGTSLLTCQGNRFLDASSNALTITINGNTTIQGFSPFAPLTVYNPATNGGSGRFDGTTDFVKTPTDANLSSTLLASNFTIECWIYVISLPNAPSIWTNSVSNSDGFSGSYVQTNGTIGTGKFGVNEFNTTNSIKLNAWNHFALVRNSGTLYVYLNGVQDPTTGAASTYLNTSATKPMQIGSSNQTSPASLNGYISDFRVVTSAVYTASFTPPTAPLAVIPGTNLLLSATNTGILDSAMINNLEAVGNTQTSTSVKKYGTGSLYFDGSDYLYSIANQTNSFNTGNFTVECWVYFASVANAQLVSAGSGTNTNAYYWQYFSSQLQFGVQNVGSITVASWTPSANTWYHLAVVRSGTNVYQFVNGTQLGTTATSSQNFVDGPTYVGYGGAGYFNGYIDDLRITKGVARYTANFTAPTAEHKGK